MTKESLNQSFLTDRDYYKEVCHPTLGLLASSVVGDLLTSGFVAYCSFQEVLTIE